jgi:hypothetical protein
MNQKFPFKRKLIKGKSLKGSKDKSQDSWLYADTNQQALAIKSSIWGFDLPGFDKWLEKLEECEGKNELIERRNELNKQKLASLKSNIEFFVLRMNYIKREDFLLPKAKNEALKKQKSIKGSEITKALVIKKTTEKLKKIAELYKKMLIDYEKKDLTLLNIHLKKEYTNRYGGNEISDYLIRKAKKLHILS